MILFVIPAYNEERNIGRTLDQIHTFLEKDRTSHQLIVVDDGSSDRTAEIVRQKADFFPCFLISYQPNRGVDEAFRRGFHQALGMAKSGDVIVTLEADGTADLEILKPLISKVEAGSGLAVASYYAQGGAVEGTAWYRKVLSRSANGVVSTLFRLRGIHTFSSFFRAYKPDALRAVLSRHGDFFSEKGFACVVELLVRIHRLRFGIEEVPMILRGAQRMGKSKMRIGQTILGYLRISARGVLGGLY